VQVKLPEYFDLRYDQGRRSMSRRFVNLYVAAFALVLVVPVSGLSARPVYRAASEHFLLDHNRIFVPLTFVLPGGTQRKTLAFVDSGDPELTLTTALVQQLHADKWKKTSDIHILFGGRLLNTTAVKDFGASKYLFPEMSMFPGLHVEANLPATVLEKYDVALNYGKQTLTLAAPGSLQHEGVRVPCKVNSATGMTSIQAEVAGESYAFAIDSGSAYTWIDRGVTERWAGTHPQWLRGIGAVGDANMNGSYPELTGMIMRLPDIDLHGLNLRQIGALGVGPGFDKAIPNFFVWYSERTPGPVLGFLGGNALRPYRLEIDYPDRATYWKRESAPDPHDLDQVGIMIRPNRRGKYFVARVATQNGKKTVAGVEAGDQLIGVDNIAVTGKTMGTVLTALHGKPGEERWLVLKRGDKQVDVVAHVTHF
jgi:hypothetical protein